MSIKSAVTQKFIDSAVKLVGTGAGHDVHLASAGPAHLRGVAAGLHFELLHRVGRRTEVQSIEGRVGIGGAIEQKIICVGTIAPDAHRGALSGTPVKRIHATRLRPVRDMGAGDGQRQINQHAAIQRQLAD